MNACLSEGRSALLSLSEAEVGRKLRVRDLRTQPVVCQRLREMGFCERAEICKLADNGALICMVCGTKVALSRRLGKQIMVELVGPPSARLAS